MDISELPNHTRRCCRFLIFFSGTPYGVVHADHATFPLPPALPSDTYLYGFLPVVRRRDAVLFDTRTTWPGEHLLPAFRYRAALLVDGRIFGSNRSWSRRTTFRHATHRYDAARQRRMNTPAILLTANSRNRSAATRQTLSWNSCDGDSGRNHRIPTTLRCLPM